MGWGSAAAATHTVVMEQLISILFVILIVLNHGQGAHQLAHGHFLRGHKPKSQGMRAVQPSYP